MPAATATKTTKKTGTTEAVESERKFHKIAAKQVQRDDVMAILHYVKVSNINSYGTNMKVESLDEGGPGSFEVQGQSLIENAFSADRYQEEITLSRTKVAKILVTSHNRPLTVKFVKKEGEERVLRGRFVSEVEHEGRSFCEDLDIKTGYRLREVDHRTLQYLIVDGVKYIVKSK